LGVIARLSGTVSSISEGRVVLDVSGVGYLVAVPQKFAASLEEGQEVALFTHMHLAEGVMDLYGFPDQETKDFFLLLTSVTGIGSKLALAVVDAVPISALAAAIEEGKSDVVVQVPGVGKKIAERIVLELKGKVAAYTGLASGDQIGADADITEALRSLGYKRDEITSALKLVGDDVSGVEERLKAALRYLRKA
jgi:holliday junction DNA helicase RuvA